MLKFLFVFVLPSYLIWSQEMKQAQSRSTNQVSELQALAEKHFNRANGLEVELSRVKKDVVLTKKQVSSLAFQFDL